LAFWRERRAGRCEAPRRRRCGVHRRGAATKQMPARRRAPAGCGSEARWRFCSLLTCDPAWLGLRTQFSSLAPSQRAWEPAAKCQVILAHALSPHFSQGFVAGQCRRAWMKAHLAHFSQRDRGLRRRTRQYVEEPDGAQRGRYARMRRRGRNLVGNAVGLEPLIRNLYPEAMYYFLIGLVQ